MSFIQQFFTSRDNNGNSETFVGQEGRLWWDPVTNQIYSSDGNTPGGIPLSGGGGNGTPGGSNSQVQFNQAGSFGGSAFLTFSSVTGTLTTVAVSATGNVVGNYFIGNGSQLTGLPATYGNADVATYLASGEDTLDIITTANVSGNYILGNGALLTGVATSAANINNGTSNVTVVSSGGNVAVGVGGTGNVAVFAASGEYITGVLSASGNITGSYFIGNGSQLTGITVSAGATITNGTSNVTVAANANTTVGVAGTTVATFASTGAYITGEISATGNITGGNFNTLGLVSATGNVSGNYFLGNGALLTGIDATSIQNGNSNVKVVSSGGDVTVSVGNTSNVAVFSGSGISVLGNITGGNILSGAAVNANTHTGTTVSVTGNIIGGNTVVDTAVVVPTVRNTAALTISTSSGDLNLQPTGNVVVNSKHINGVTNPVQNQDVATKIYVDNLVTTAIAYHEAVAAATTTTLAATTSGTISYTQPNGAGNGVGALLTTTGVFNLIDTANVQTVGTRILVKNEGNAVFNGVYTWANATNIVRSTDADTYGPANPNTFSINDYFFVNSGNVNAGSAWIVDSPSGTITFGTSNIAFAQFSSSQTYTANTAAGVSLAGTVINAKVDGTTTAFDGGGNISVKASATLTTPNIGVAIGTSLSTTGNITANYFNGNGALLTGVGSVTSVATGTGLTGGSITSTGTIAIDSTVATLTGTQTLTNKRIDPRVVSAASASSLTPSIATADIYAYTALAAGLTVNAPTGTPVDGDKLIFRLLDNGTARALTWNATYTVIGVTLPTTTVVNKTTYVGCIYNANNTRWDVITVTTEGYTSEIPSQTGNSGKYLTTDGSVLSWATVAGGGGGVSTGKAIAMTLVFG